MQIANLKHSKQRDAILEFLMTRKDHPTADTVYQNVLEQFPNISLGTVYRNLNLLAASGEIQKLCCGDGTDHFDATVAPHYHFVCEECGKVMDLDMPQIAFADEKAMDKCIGEIHSHQVFFYGLCKKCM